MTRPITPRSVLLELPSFPAVEPNESDEERLTRDLQEMVAELQPLLPPGHRAYYRFESFILPNGDLSYRGGVYFEQIQPSEDE